jgi:hypothetical protein
MTDRGHHGEGEHDERDVAMPAMPDAALTMLLILVTLFVLIAVSKIPAKAVAPS